MNKKIIYVDMDNTLADYCGHAKWLGIDPNKAKHVPGFFHELNPIPGAIEAYKLLDKYFDVYILSTCPWSNPMVCVEKIEWVNEWLPCAKKKLILSHHKNLNSGDYIIDDTTLNGVDKFSGEHIQIGSEKYPNWKSVIRYIFAKEKMNLYLQNFTFLKDM